MENLFETLAQATKPESMSTTVKHTPGPWKVRKNEPLVDIPYSLMAGEIHVATVSWNMRIGAVQQQSEVEANAKLIAAAPDLLELLQEWYENNMKGIDPSPGSFGGRVFDVLKKSVAI